MGRALVEKELTSKVPAVTDAEIIAWYQANQARVQGASLDQVRQPIRSHPIYAICLRTHFQTELMD
jgi:hypothetical protein